MAITEALRLSPTTLAVNDYLNRTRDIYIPGKPEYGARIALQLAVQTVQHGNYG